VHAVGGSTLVQAMLLFSALFLSFVLPADGPPWLACWWQSSFHFECPGCGLTRSFIAMANGHFSDALSHNPVGPFLFVAALLAFYQRVAELANTRLLYDRDLEGRVLTAALVLLLISWSVRLAAAH
jgi:hypothetical protein